MYTYKSTPSGQSTPLSIFPPYLPAGSLLSRIAANVSEPFNDDRMKPTIRVGEILQATGAQCTGTAPIRLLGQRNIHSCTCGFEILWSLLFQYQIDRSRQ